MAESDALNHQRRHRRRVRRLVAVAGFLLMTTGLAWFFESQTTTTVIVIRHAETLPQEPDPGLSPQGERRARELVRVLGNADIVAGVDTILVTTMRRTRETALPLSVHNGAPVISLEDHARANRLAKRIREKFAGDIVLVVTEAEHIQPLIARLQGSKRLADIADGEHDNLYIVSIPWFGKVKTLQLKYGDRYIPPL